MQAENGAREKTSAAMAPQERSLETSSAAAATGVDGPRESDAERALLRGQLERIDRENAARSAELREAKWRLSECEREKAALREHLSRVERQRSEDAQSLIAASWRLARLEREVSARREPLVQAIYSGETGDGGQRSGPSQRNIGENGAEGLEGSGPFACDWDPIQEYEDDHGVIKQLFDRAKADSSVHAISLDELRAALVERGLIGHGTAELLLQAVLSTRPVAASGQSQMPVYLDEFARAFLGVYNEIQAGDTFNEIDLDKNEVISKNEVEMAETNRIIPEKFGGILLSKLKNDGAEGIPFESFRTEFNAFPRTSGERLQFARSLCMERRLARLLKRGNAFDSLRGIKEMSDTEMELHIEDVCAKFSALLPGLLRERLYELRIKGTTIPEDEGYIDILKLRLSQDSAGMDAEHRKMAEKVALELESMKRVIFYRLQYDQNCTYESQDSIKFDSAIDDGEVIMSLFRNLDTSMSGSISKNELLNSGLVSKVGNTGMAKVLRQAFECNLDDLDQALAHLEGSDFGTFARFKENQHLVNQRNSNRKSSENDQGVSVIFDRNASVKAVYDAALAAGGPADYLPNNSVTKTNVDCLISQIEQDHFGESKQNNALVVVLHEISNSLVAAHRELNFLSVKAAARRVPRVAGQRMEWVRAMGLDAAFARHLPAGTLDDGLFGIRSVCQDREWAERVLQSFYMDTRHKFMAALEQAEKVTGSRNAIEANSKFEGFPGSFANLTDFDAGAEVSLQLGYPNPDVAKGIRLEHTEHPSVTRIFVTPNYRIATCLLIEYWWAIYEEYPEDANIRNVQLRAKKLLHELRSAREIGMKKAGLSENVSIKDINIPLGQEANMSEHILFPGEVGDMFVESFLLVRIQFEGEGPNQNKITKCSNAVIRMARVFLITEEEIARGFTFLDQSASSAWMARRSSIVGILSLTSDDTQEARSFMCGLVLPMCKERAEENCESLRIAVAQDTSTPVHCVSATVEACKTWVFCKYSTIKDLRRQLGEMGIADLQRGEWHAQSDECLTRDTLCSEAVTWFIRTQLQQDFLLALHNAEDVQLHAIKLSWGLTENSAELLTRDQSIKLVADSLITEEQWLQVEDWVELYRGRIEGRSRLGLNKLMQREERKIRQFNLVQEEVLTLYLYTGPEFMPINAICRNFPKNLMELLQGDDTAQRNTLCTTLFCISSGLKKLGRHTELPESRVVYRGLGKMLLPQQFWVPHGTPAWRGGVERAFLSTTADKNVALFYANGRGTVVEISIGRIQIGGDVSFLSMYPGEKEITFPPFTCLEANGDPRLERTKAGEVIIFPLQASVNPKAETVEELQGRRKRIHQGMCKLLREDLAHLAEQKLLQVEESGTILSIMDSRTRIKERIKEQFDSLVREHDSVDPATFNEDDVEYKRLMAEAIDSKSYALSKLDVYIESLSNGLEQQSVERIVRAPLRSFASPAVVLELRTGLIGFPWKAVVEDKSATIALGDWNAAETSREALELVVRALGDNINLRSVLAKGVKLDLPDGWASTALQWTNSDAVRALPATVALLLRNCSSLTSLSLSSNALGAEGIGLIGISLQALTDLQILDLSNNSMGPSGVISLSRTIKDLRSLQALDISNNGLGPSGVTSLISTFAGLSTLRELNLRNNHLTKVSMRAVSEALAGRQESLKILFEPEEPASSQQMGTVGCSTSPWYRQNCAGTYKQCPACQYTFCDYHHKPNNSLFGGGHICKGY